MTELRLMQQIHSGVTRHMAQTERCVKLSFSLLLYRLDCVIMNLLLLLLFVQYVITWLTLAVCAVCVVSRAV